MIELYVQNSFCLIKRDDSIELSTFMYNYFTSTVEETKYWRGGRKVKETKNIEMYTAVKYEEVLYYQVPRGLVNLLPTDVFNKIKWHDYSTNKLIVPKLSYSEIAESLNPYASFSHLRSDQVVAVSRALRDKQGVLQLPTGCFTGDTEVIINDGTYKIEDLVGKKDKVSISLSDNTITRDLVNNPIINITKTRETRDLVLVALKNGSVIKCTPNHRFMTIDGVYKYAGNLNSSEILMPYSSDKDIISDTSWYTIEEVLPFPASEDVPVYDMEVENTHNYVVKTSDTGGVFVHNSGKTEIMSSIIKILEKSNPGMKSLVIEPTGVLRNNTSKRFNSYNINSKVYNDTRGELTSDVTVAHTAALLNDLKKDPSILTDVQAVFWDECFTGNTKVLLPSGKEASLKDVYNDDSINEVISFDNHEGLVSRRILRKIKSINESNWIKVKISNPLNPSKFKTLVLTENHKVLTTNGYVEASKLKLYEQVFLIQSFSSYNFLHSKYSYSEQSKSDRYIKYLEGKDTYEYKLYPDEFPQIGVVDEVSSIKVDNQFKYNLETEIDHNYVADGVVVSNCHHLQSNSWNTLNTSLPNVEYNISLSALAISSNHIQEHNIKNLTYPEAQVVGVSGPVIINVPVKYYIDNGYLAKPVVIQMYNKVTLSEKNADKGNVWSIIRKEGIESPHRTKLTSEVTHEFTSKGRKVLILVGTKKQGNNIATSLGSLYPDLNEQIGISYGSGVSMIVKNGKIVDSEKDTIEMFSNNEVSIDIATSHMDEGVDIKNLDAVILAGGGNKARRIIQRVGRALRKTKNGKYAYIIDFSDDGPTALKRQSENRLNVYEDIVQVDPRYIFTSVNMDRFRYEFKKLES